VQAIFRHLCHLTAGDRARAEGLLCETYAAVAQSGVAGSQEDEGFALIVAHQTFLADSTPNKGTVEHLQFLGPLNVALLNLHTQVGLSTEQIAVVCGQPTEHLDALLRQAQISFEMAEAQRYAPMSVTQAFRASEYWLDDQTCARVNAAFNRAAQPVGGPHHLNTRRNKLWVLGAAVVLGAIVVSLISWSRHTPLAAIESQPTFASTPPLELFTSSWITDGLDEPLVIVPDTIVRYGNNRIGISWQGPCNRPAASIEISTLGEQNTLTLTTGSFPITTCSGGMPERWTAVVQPQHSLASGEILPVDDVGNTIVDFGGYVIERTTDDVVGLDAKLGPPTSTLVDQNSDPWTYTTGCVAPRRVRYPSPVGALFEAEATDTSTCGGHLLKGNYLIGPDERFFPHNPDERFGIPVDCQGPRQSQTDLRGEPSAVREDLDGEWSTWDGCKVRVNVVRSRVLECPFGTVRVLTVAENIGEQFLRRYDAVNYVRDPDALLVGVPGLAYDTRLPANALDTGLRYGPDQLWFDPADTNGVYIVTGDKVERWPKDTLPVQC
jgi:hypothetical protein